MQATRHVTNGVHVGWLVETFVRPAGLIMCSVNTKTKQRRVVLLHRWGTFEAVEGCRNSRVICKRQKTITCLFPLVTSSSCCKAAIIPESQGVEGWRRSWTGRKHIFFCTMRQKCRRCVFTIPHVAVLTELVRGRGNVNWSGKCVDPSKMSINSSILTPLSLFDYDAKVHACILPACGLHIACLSYRRASCWRMDQWHFTNCCIFCSAYRCVQAVPE